MLNRIYTCSILGLKVKLVEVEVDISPSLPTVIVVGLPDKAVQESKERIKASFKNSGYEFPLAKVTINLAPADIHKTGSAFDLPIAVAILKILGIIKNIQINKSIFLGELALDGQVRKVNGILSIIIWAKKHGFTDIFIPEENQAEASLIKGLNVYIVPNLKSLINHLNGTSCLDKVLPINLLEYLEKIETKEKDQNGLYVQDMAYIKGQAMAKRALEVAASGGHNVLFIGQPGSGKTLLAKSYANILPKMTEQEIIETTQIYSILGKLPPSGIITKRPFCAPHHSASHVSIVGGGSKLKPGEISLAHRGVLFLDEFPEFTRETIEVLRQPMEEGFVNITRASGSVTYPSRFCLMAAANPTPSGFDLDDPMGQHKPQNINLIKKYQAKFSGPILDRIDIQVEVNRPSKEELKNDNLEEASNQIKIRVQKARDIQTKRFVNSKITTNAEMRQAEIKQFCKLDLATQSLLDKAMDKYNLSARGYIKLIKLSRTIADLDNSQDIQLKHLAESLQYRGRWS
jgi:magnesium chelatase family protein